MGHEHHHPAPRPEHGALRTAFFLNLFFTVVEVGGGFATDSIAVLSDALHDLGDCLVLGAAWYFTTLAQRGRDHAYTYGYARYSMLGGWLAGLVLIIGSLVMAASAIPRFWEPHTPHAMGMMALAAFGIVMNGLAAWRLQRGRTLNERGAFLHLLEDVLGWAAVLIGGLILYLTHWSLIDPLLSILISVFIGINAVRMLRKGTGILMQSHPGISTDEIERELRGIPHVRDLHDQHVWSLDGRYTVFTVHLVVDELSDTLARQVKQQARLALGRFGVQHATIELETPDEVCELEHH